MPLLILAPLCHWWPVPSGSVWLPQSLTFTSAPEISSVTGQSLPTAGVVTLSIDALSFSVQHAFVIADIVPSDVILGADLLQYNSTIVNFTTKILTLPGVMLPLSPADNQSPPSPNLFTSKLPSVATTMPPPPVRLQLSETVTIPPQHEVIAPLCVSNNTALPPSGSFLIELLPSFSDKYPLLEVGESVTSQNNLLVHCLNRGPKPVNLHPKTHVATAVPITYPHLFNCASVAADLPSAEELKVSPLPEEASSLITTFVSINCSHLFLNNQQDLLNLLLQYHDVFSFGDDDPGYCDVAPHRIDTGSHAPIKQPAYRVPFHHRTQLQALLNKLLRQGVITPPSSPWASPIVLVPKPNVSLCLCVDYRKLSKILLQMRTLFLVSTTLLMLSSDARYSPPLILLVATGRWLWIPKTNPRLPLPPLWVYMSSPFSQWAAAMDLPPSSGSCNMFSMVSLSTLTLSVVPFSMILAMALPLFPVD